MCWRYRAVRRTMPAQHLGQCFVESLIIGQILSLDCSLIAESIASSLFLIQSWGHVISRCPGCARGFVHRLLNALHEKRVLSLKH
jgi:hypothetical protein